MTKAAKSLSIFKLILISFILIILVPVGITGYDVYQKLWKNAWNETIEKHQLLAINLTNSISLYVQDRSTQLGYLSRVLSEREFSSDEKSELLFSFFNSFSELSSLAYVNHEGVLEKFLHNDTDIILNPTAPVPIDVFKDKSYFTETRDLQIPLIEAITVSPFTNKPTIIITKPVLNTDPTAINASFTDSPTGMMTDVLIAELSIEPIEALRRGIKFGSNGQPAIFDPSGKVIAHANDDWMAGMKDLSSLDVVQKMLNHETGVTEYIAPETGTSMIAGFTFVPMLSWGVMIAQPKIEITEEVEALIASHIKWSLGAFLCAILLAIPLASWITRPINRLATSAHRVATSNYSEEMAQVSGRAPKEVVQLGNTLQSLISGLRASKANVEELNQQLQIKVDDATKELIDANKKLEKIAETDFLTGLSNRRYFESELEKSITLFKDTGQTSALLYVDLDNFKIINDTYGHVVGDDVLQDLAKLIRESTDDEDLVARLGGDECAVIIRSGNNTDARRKADMICQKISDYRKNWNNHQIRLTCSIGLLMIDSDKLTKVDILQQADASCYLSKINGGNRVWEYDPNQPEMRKHWGDLELLNMFSEAMKSNRLNLVLQPIIALQTDLNYSGHEVLLRMQDDQGQLVKPDTFLPAVIQYKLMPDLDRWVIANAFKSIHENKDFNFNKLFINISAQTLEEGNFVTFIEEIEPQYASYFKHICFEITETTGIDDLKSTAAIMNALTKKGFSFALDDFGSGLSSFQYLKELPITLVKIDGNFILDAETSSLDRKIVRSIVSVCQSQRIETVAECVESEAIYNQVKSLGIDYAQGFYLGSPKTLNQIEPGTALAN